MPYIDSINLPRLKKEKLNLLAETEGLELTAMLEEASFDGIAPSICMEVGCDYMTTLEPDAESVACPECDGWSVDSCLVIAGLI